PSRSCWGMPASRRHRSIRTSTPRACWRCIAERIRARMAADMRIALPALLSLVWLCGAQAEEATCPGRSIIPDIEKSQLESYKAALADFAAVPNSSGLLWKIEKGGVTPSWLFGTIHIPFEGL